MNSNEMCCVSGVVFSDLPGLPAWLSGCSTVKLLQDCVRCCSQTLDLQRLLLVNTKAVPPSHHTADHY